MSEHEDVDDFLAHYGVPGMKWGKRQASSGGSNKEPSSRKQRDADIKAARGRLNEGKSLVQKMINQDSFGKTILGGKKVLELNNKNASPEDIAMAAKMTTGHKVMAVGVLSTGILASVLLRKSF